MSSPALPNEAWEAVEIGEDLGSLDYVMTAEMIADYRRVVDNPHAAYPTVAARHPANLFYRRYRAQLRVPNTGHDSEYFNPPLPGKRINVSARIADKYIRPRSRILRIPAASRTQRSSAVTWMSGSAALT